MKDAILVTSGGGGTNCGGGPPGSQGYEARVRGRPFGQYPEGASASMVKTLVASSRTAAPTTKMVEYANFGMWFICGQSTLHIHLH